MTPGCQAAVDVGAQHGIHADEPVLLQETNNTVVWLRPHDVIAKVGVRPDSREALVREHHVARALVALDAAVAEPVVGTAPMTHVATGFVVTLWARILYDASAEPPDHMVGDSLRRLHEALAGCDLDLPDFRAEIQLARGVLIDGRRAALTPNDRSLLRAVFDTLLPDLDTRAFEPRALHGEPHEGNRLLTSSGIRWIDFESACRGPVEWDLAFLPREGRKRFPEVDEDLLAVLTALNSARVATWCGVQARFPEMRRHGQYHLDLLRARSTPGSS